MLWTIMLFPALAAEPVEAAPRWSGSAVLSTSFVSGPINAGVRGATLDGGFEEGATWNPSFNLAMSLGASYDLRRFGSLGLTWSVYRDQAISDVPGLYGSTRTTGVDTTDPVISWSAPRIAGSGHAYLSTGARYAVPLSRTSLLCNPTYGGLGASLGGTFVFGDTAVLSVGASADRALHRYDAAPRGRCGVGDLSTDAADGTASADAVGFSARPNTAWVFDQSVSMQGWHGLFGLIGDVASKKGFQNTITGASVAVRERLVRTADPVVVQTLDGDLQLGESATPAVVTIPWSVTVGYRFHPHLSGRLTASNQAPGLLYDPAARLQTLPATTTLTLAVAGSW